MVTFLGETTKRISVRTRGAEEDYPIWQFGFEEFLNSISKLGWHPQVKKDLYTDSLPVYKSYGFDDVGVVRTQYFIICMPGKSGY
jgi:hypothetical protein